MKNEDLFAEQIARIIDPSSWRVMDSYLAETKRKYAGQHVGWDPEAFKHKESLAKARKILGLEGFADLRLQLDLAENALAQFHEHEGWTANYIAQRLFDRARDSEARCEAAEQALERMRGFVRIAIDQAKRMKNSARLMGPREVHDDPRLAKLWVRWTYDQGKQLLDALKPARDALNPTPQGGKPALDDETQEDRDRANEESWFFDMDGKP